MKVYFDGRYWGEEISEKEKEYLLKVAPQKYFALFPKPIQSNPLKKGVLIYQVAINNKPLDGGFIPIKTGFNHNFENDIIIDVWKKREWINAKYVGVLSWRFYEKTGLTSKDLKLTKDVHCYAPPAFKKFEHPYSRNGFPSVNEMVRIADEYKLFDFKLKGYKVNKIVWCNYWIAKPHIFDDYCTRYLSKAIEFFKTKPCYNLTELHRGQQVPAFTFFLEGLFSIYLQREKIDYEST